MRACTLTILFSVAVSLISGTARAEISLAPLFTPNAVLQRDKPVPIWGKAAPEEEVTVEFDGQKKQSTADKDGRWKVELDAMPASDKEKPMTISGSKTAGPLTLAGILVGDVWFASGQSNMLHIVSKCLNPEAEIAAADYPKIRLFKVWFNASVKPEETITGKPSKWTICRPGSAGSFGAVSYFFARDLHKEIKVPIGIINSSWGGTQIESWMSASTLQSSPYAGKIADRWKTFLADYEVKFAKYEKDLAAWKEAEAKKDPAAKSTEMPREPQGAVSRWTPNGLFNSMVHPYIPYALRGIIWYQGEANTMRFDEYGSLFKSLITDWRKDFGQGDLPFYFVQLANYELKADKTKQTWAFLREAQLEALTLPNTGAAITVDIGDPKDAHYANKQEAGRRLALVALANTYGKEVAFKGPIFDKAVAEGNQIRVSFQNNPELALKPVDETGFEVAGADKTFHPAEGKIDGQTLLVSSPAVPQPIAIRYAWYNAPKSGLSDTAGLPAPPFRSDDWTPAPPNPMGTVPDAGDDAGR